MSRRGASLGFALVGTLALAVAIAWWWIVFSPVVATASLGVWQTVPCLAGTSDLCSLAQALCRTDHVLGIRRYHPEALWLALAALTLGVLGHPGASIRPRR